LTILILGSACDDVVSRLTSRLEIDAVPFVHVNTADLPDVWSVVVEVSSQGDVSGQFINRSESICFEDIGAIFVRDLLDSFAQPSSLAATSASWEVLVTLLNSIDCLVINRPRSQGSNGAKPLQYPFIRRISGLQVPSTRVSADGRMVASFVQTYGEVIAKSVSGLRRKVHLVDLQHASRPLTGPIQVQPRIDGIDVRVHVIGTSVLAHRVTSVSVDYRFPAADEPSPVFERIEPPRWLSDACVRLTVDLELVLAGIDFRVTSTGEWFCFEVNPSPFYTYFEDSKDMEVTQAVAKALSDPWSTEAGRRGKRAIQ
jgi:glutathione synthase/RimK-type ligase-like ATP-grasp enzyme